MRRHIFILVPAPVPTGPIKGAHALANALVSDRDVTLVALRDGPGASAFLNENVRSVSLAAQRGFFAKVQAYRDLLRLAGGRRATASISMCLSADAANMLCSNLSVTCASVRSNLYANYFFSYGSIGRPLAAAHLVSLRAADRVVVMTRAMARQVARLTGRSKVSVIPNFIDEQPLENFRIASGLSGPLRFVFIGSLTERKQPLLFVRAMAELRSMRIDACARLIGSGPMERRLREEVVRYGLGGDITLNGFLASPYEVLCQSDVLVLPSLSEGLSRACLEAMYLGVPCVVRAVDGNSELIRSESSGVLFRDDKQLVHAMLRAAEIARSPRRAGPRPCLLPTEFRQANAARAYLDLVEA